MSLHPSSHLHPLPQVPLPAFAFSEKRKYPRVFLLTYDNSKVKARHRLAELQEKRESWGTLYPNGFITLDNGAPFQGLADLHSHFAETGQYTLYWLENGELREEVLEA